MKKGTNTFIVLLLCLLFNKTYTQETTSLKAGRIIVKGNLEANNVFTKEIDCKGTLTVDYLYSEGDMATNKLLIYGKADVDHLAVLSGQNSNEGSDTDRETSSHYANGQNYWPDQFTFHQNNSSASSSSSFQSYQNGQPCLSNNTSDNKPEGVFYFDHPIFKSTCPQSHEATSSCDQSCTDTGILNRSSSSFNLFLANEMHQKSDEIRPEDSASQVGRSNENIHNQGQAKQCPPAPAPRRKWLPQEEKTSSVKDQVEKIEKEERIRQQIATISLQQIKQKNQKTISY